MSTCKLTIGATLLQGKYRIESVLGQGGFGITYLAVHTILDRKVAIKEFFPKEYCDRDGQTSHITIGTKSNTEIVAQLHNKFIKEAKNISKLDHPNIIKIQDVFEENNTAYYVMEYIDGESLEQTVSKHGPLSGETAFSYIRQIASALNYMHTTPHLLHLDVKPANIMVRNEDSCPILIDFGLSKAYTDSGEQTSTTPHGMSPGYSPMEQYNLNGVSDFTPQTDVYSLGATFYKLVTGDAPLAAPARVERPELSFPPTLNKSLADLITRCMKTVKRERPSTMAAVLDLMAKCDTADEVHPEADTPTPPVVPGNPTKVIDAGKRPGGKPAQPTGKPAGKSSALKYVVIAVAIALLAGVVTYFASSKKPKSAEPTPAADSIGEETPIESAAAPAATIPEAEEKPAVEDVQKTGELKAEDPKPEPKKPEPKKPEAAKPEPKPAPKPDAKASTPATTTSRPASDDAAVKIAAQNVTAANMEAGMRVTGATVSGKTLIFNVSCSRSIYDEDDCSASNPIFRQAMTRYMGSSSRAAAAAQVAKSQGYKVRFSFSGAKNFSINY